jgi:hypothetical protein
MLADHEAKAKLALEQQKLIKRLTTRVKVLEKTVQELKEGSKTQIAEALAYVDEYEDIEKRIEEVDKELIAEGFTWEYDADTKAPILLPPDETKKK